MLGEENKDNLSETTKVSDPAFLNLITHDAQWKWTFLIYLTQEHNCLCHAFYLSLFHISFTNILSPWCNFTSDLWLIQFCLWPRYRIISSCLIQSVMAAEVANGKDCCDYAGLWSYSIYPAVNSQVNIRLNKHPCLWNGRVVKQSLMVGRRRWGLYWREEVCLHV